MKSIDCRAHKCPYPVVESRKLMLDHPGEPLQVLVGDETARENVTRLAAGQGYEVASSTVEGGYQLDLAPGAPPVAPPPDSVPAGKTVAFFTSDQMGSGDPELGRVLLKNFLFTMAEAKSPPATLLFVNAGVKLTSEGSEVLEALEKLACQGVDIASCGLCLDFFHLKEKLAVGRTTNMVEILETLQTAARTIRP